MKTPVLSIVVPCYNEEDVIEESCERLTLVLDRLVRSDRIAESSFIIFIDDGSRDSTWKLIAGQAKSRGHVRGLKLSRNFGHQNALLAGLMAVQDKSDIAITIDADLQQDENAMGDFVDRYLAGYDIVLGVREDRNADGILKRSSAFCFYTILKLMGIRAIRNHADYRLMSSRTIAALSGFQEANLFLRGLIVSMGFKTATVRHAVKSRRTGSSKYSVLKMLSLALDGVTSFSVVPIRIVTLLGFLVFVLTAVMAIYILFVSVAGRPVAGWASTVLPIYFIGGIQLLSLGLIGEYVGKIYKETKRRPRFIVEEEA